MTDPTVIDQKQRRQARRDRKVKSEPYGLTRSTQIFIVCIVVLLVLLFSGAITYLTLALNESRNANRSQNIAVSEWSRRYVSLYDQYTNKVGAKPTSLSPSAIDYLIATETVSPDAGAAIPGLPTGTGDGTTTKPPAFSFNITNSDGSKTMLTCAPATNYDPLTPKYDCK